MKDNALETASKMLAEAEKTYFLYAQFVNETAKAVHTHFIERPATKSLCKVSLVAPETSQFSSEKFVSNQKTPQ